MIIIIPPFITTILTFPGVILHEMAHKFFCDYYNIDVFKVAYFRPSSKAGHVIHRPIFDPKQNAIIALAPLFVNSLISILLLVPWMFMNTLGTSFMWQISLGDLFLIWVGFACALSALPSDTDTFHVSKEAHGLYTISQIVKFLNWFGFVGSLLWFVFLFLISLAIMSFITLCII